MPIVDHAESSAAFTSLRGAGKHTAVQQGLPRLGVSGLAVDVFLRTAGTGTAPVLKH